MRLYFTNAVAALLLTNTQYTSAFSVAFPSSIRKGASVTTRISTTTKLRATEEGKPKEEKIETEASYVEGVTTKSTFGFYTSSESYEEKEEVATSSITSDLQSSLETVTEKTTEKPTEDNLSTSQPFTSSASTVQDFVEIAQEAAPIAPTPAPTTTTTATESTSLETTASLQKELEVETKVEATVEAEVETVVEEAVASTQKEIDENVSIVNEPVVAVVATAETVDSKIEDTLEPTDATIEIPEANNDEINTDSSTTVDTKIDSAVDTVEEESIPKEVSADPIESFVEKPKIAFSSIDVNGSSDSKTDAVQSENIQQVETEAKTEPIETPIVAKSSKEDDIEAERGWKIDGKKSRTQRIMEKVEPESQTGGAGGVSTWDAFLRADANWKRLRESTAFDYDPKLKRSTQNGVARPTPFVTSDGGMGNPEGWKKLKEQYAAADERSKTHEKYLDYDIVLCGGTLGIFVATALQIKGHSVCVVEGGKLRGREQEWNISMDELLELVELGVLTMDDVDAAIKTEFPACRSGFKNREAPTIGSYAENGIGYELTTPDVLNLGVAPGVLIENAKNRFIEFGGVVKENTPIKGIVVSDDIGSAIDIGEEEKPITARLVLDCMGNGSPISRQQRFGRKPDGVCCVVGSCAGGFDKETNVQGDIIYTNSEIQDKGENGMLQYFWEAFPVGIGRDGKEPGTSDVKTTYMFTYLDAEKERPDLSTLMEDYWDLLPIYQPSIKDPETDLDVKRVLFAFFPTYRDSPLQPEWSRILAVGDASGIQSPLSFGGFGALTRHLGRISGAVSEALKNDCLDKEDLSLINAYTPNLSAAWMFQKAMSVRIGQNVDQKFINRLLATNFQVMDDMGIDTIKPFLQDVVRVDGLVGSLARSFVADPLYMPVIVAHVGIPTLVEWMGHVGMMGLYSTLDATSPLMKPFVDRMDNPRKKFLWRRRMEAWKFGSGGDYVFPVEEDK